MEFSTEKSSLMQLFKQKDNKVFFKMAASFVKHFCGRLPQLLFKLPISKQVIGSKTTYRYALNECEHRGSFGFDRKLLLAFSRALCYRPINDTVSQNHKLSSCQNRRQLSSGGQNDGDNGNGKRIKLMDFKEIIWPHPLKSLRNLFFSFLIRGYFDKHYSPEIFLLGAEQVHMHCRHVL